MITIIVINKKVGLLTNTETNGKQAFPVLIF